MPIFTSDWFSAHIHSWQYIFRKVGWAAEQPKVVIEIGSYEGRASIWILENLLKNPESRLFCVDTFADADLPTSYGSRFKANLAEARNGPDDNRPHIYAGLSSDFLLQFNVLKNQADFIYVDGSHRASDVLVDLVLSFRILRVGGVIICDDYLGGASHDLLLDSPKLAIDAFTNIFRDQIEIINGVPLYQIAFRKIADRSQDDPSSRGEA